MALKSGMDYQKAHCSFYYQNCDSTTFLTFFFGWLILSIVCLVIAGYRIKALNRSLWNIIWLFIPLVAFFYALWLGITRIKGNVCKCRKMHISVETSIFNFAKFVQGGEI
jgi:hypothetical protein